VVEQQQVTNGVNVLETAIIYLRYVLPVFHLAPVVLLTCYCLRFDSYVCATDLQTNENIPYRFPFIFKSVAFRDLKYSRNSNNVLSIVRELTNQRITRDIHSVSRVSSCLAY